MAGPIVIDIPHTLGRDEARRRLRDRIGGLAARIPGGGAAQIDTSWPSEDRLALQVRAMGQSVAATLDVEDALVRVTMTLPLMLSMMGGAIAAMVRRTGEEVLLDAPARDAPPR